LAWCPTLIRVIRGQEISEPINAAGANFRPAAKRLSEFCRRPVSLLSVRKIRPGESSREACGPSPQPASYFLLFFLADFFAVFFLAVFFAAAISWLLRVRRLFGPSVASSRTPCRIDALCRKFDE
jgi:hypothetical protein